MAETVRVLFVSGSPGGGSARSTVELASRLVERGHVSGVLSVTRGPAPVKSLHERAVDASARVAGTPLAAPVAALTARLGRRLLPLPEADGVACWSAHVPENALDALLASFRPDVVVASSLDRPAWRTIRSKVAAAGAASVLYLREESATRHLSDPPAPPDVLVANAAIHAERAAALGHTAVVVPSVVELDRCLVETTRERVLFVNPIAISGVDIAFAVAAALPHVPFTFAESWVLTDAEHDDLAHRAAALPNVELRRPVADPRELYADVRLLFAPYLTNGRPRVVLEAQANGIPVLATDLPGLHEGVGPGGRVLPPDAAVTEWTEALEEMLAPAHYDELVVAARAHARRDDVDPAGLAARFEAVLERACAIASASAAVTPTDGGGRA
ncbi:MAG TPA: glycosyltransferase [Acidimicrobiia bacterium]|nr:glycosyltransferase [Acidimicrobiia bacterium]